ncbi:MAG: hypothetical protein N3A38_01935 [Planctomycetota bacterium]|nr:hypothetical protein [Planctomycetota bacterium]
MASRLAFLLWLTASVGAWATAAEGPARDPFASPVGGARISILAEAFFYPESDVRHLRGSMSWFEPSFFVSVPVSKQRGEHDWTFYAAGAAMDFDTDAVLPGSGDPFPDELWDPRIGTVLRVAADKDLSIGGNLEVSSPCDRPFAGIRETVFRAGVFGSVEIDEHWSVTMALYYSNDRELFFKVPRYKEAVRHLPVPAVRLCYRRGRDLAVSAGPGFAGVFWAPGGNFEVEASYAMIRNVRASVGWRPVEELKLYGGFEWSNRHFYRHDRRRDEDRLWYYEKRAEIGVRWHARPGRCASSSVFLDAAGGYAFDRFWFEGEDYRDRMRDRFRLQDVPFVRLKLGVSF